MNPKEASSIRCRSRWPARTLGAALLLLVSALHADAGETDMLLIQPLASNEPVTPQRQGSALVIGQSRIEPWLLPIPQCDRCELRVARRHHPVGPDLILSLYQGDSLRWQLIDSRQRQWRLADGSLIQHQGSQLQWRRGDTELILRPGQTRDWQGCQYHLHRLATLEPNSNAGIVSEASNIRLQVSMDCSR